MEWNPQSPTCKLRPDAATVRSEMRIFLDIVERHYGRKPLIYTSIDFFDDNDTQAFVAADAEKIVVCFRGTESDRLCDWLTDADISLVEGPLEGRVHGGFYDALSDVWHVVDRAVQQLDRYGHKTLWVTGHSLGGALASLAAEATPPDLRSETDGRGKISR